MRNELEQLHQQITHELGPCSQQPRVELDDIDFVNRKKQLREIIEETSEMQCWIIDAPAGYGKSRFIRRIKEYYEHAGWVCCHIEIERGASHNIQALGQQILESLNESNDALLGLSEKGVRAKISTVLSQVTVPTRQGPMPICKVGYRGVGIFFDNVEVLDIDTFSSLAKIINNLRDNLCSFTHFFNTNNRLTVCLSGRDIRRRGSIFKNLGRSYKEIILLPYKFKSVEEVVRKYVFRAAINLDDEQCKYIAARFMYLNGGHPGCIAKTLQTLKKGENLTASQLLEDKNAYLEHSFRVLTKLENENEAILPLLG
jgi:hypothetical protein